MAPPPLLGGFVVVVLVVAVTSEVTSLSDNERRGRGGLEMVLLCEAILPKRQLCAQHTQDGLT